MRYIVILFMVFCFTACDGGNHLAEVKGKKITKTQFDAYLKFKRLNAHDEARRQRLIDQYLEREALAAAVEDSKVLDKDLVEAELNEFRKEMLINRYFENYLKKAVNEEAVRNYYGTHAADYEQRQAEVAHILIRTNARMSEPERQAKLTKAQEAYSMIRSGKPFDKVAETYSEDKVSVKKGGSLGWVKEGSIDQRFSKVTFGLAKDEVSEPFETSFGFHIVKLLDGPRTVKRPYEAVAGDIRYRLRNEAKQAEMERLTKSITIKKK